jgi:glucose uptake protein GlcU
MKDRDMVPLQFGVPGGPELIIIGIIALLLLVVPFVLAYWVYTDATRRGNENAALWALAVGGLTVLTFFGGLLAFPIYIWDRGKEVPE